MERRPSRFERCKASQEVATAVAFLSSDAADRITDQDITVAAGYGPAPGTRAGRSRIRTVNAMNRTAQENTMALTLDTYRLLGRSGLRVSPLALGTATFGTEWGWGAERDEARKLFDRYTELGGNVFDTASTYTDGSSERLLGNSPAPTATSWCRPRSTRRCVGLMTRIPGGPTARACWRRWKPVCAG